MYDLLPKAWAFGQLLGWVTQICCPNQEPEHQGLVLQLLLVEEGTWPYMIRSWLEEAPSLTV